jgi:hypothetical protein
MDHPTSAPVDRFALVAFNALLAMLYGLLVIAELARGWFALGYITLAPMVLIAGVCAYGAWAAYRGRSGAAAIATFGALVAAALVAMAVFKIFLRTDWR